MRVIFCLIIGVIPYLTSGQLIFEYKKQVYVDEEGGYLNYRLLEPLNYSFNTNYPLVIFLHGSGERGDDNELQLVHGSGLFSEPENRKKYPAFVIFPQCPENDSWANIDDWTSTEMKILENPVDPMKKLFGLLDMLKENLPIDPDRIYLSGLSMGGYGTLDAIVRRPNEFAAALPICGGGDVEKISKLNNLPMWIFHGSDDAVVNPQFSRNIYKALMGNDGNVRYTEYAGVNHDSWTDAFAEPDFLSWMFAQKRK